jgi:hypothetical protein
MNEVIPRQERAEMQDSDAHASVPGEELHLSSKREPAAAVRREDLGQARDRRLTVPARTMRHTAMS